MHLPIAINMHWIYAHLIGDYLLQTDWMALNKKEKWIPCFIHVVVYLVPFLLCGLEWWQLLLIGLQHYFIDRTMFIEWYCRKIGAKRMVDPKNIMFPWSWIIIDNIFHILWIAGVVWV